MRLLILTQKVDQNDDVLGFFHGWVREFAKHYEQVIVIALGVGEYDLPANVRVLSLGKERGKQERKRTDLGNSKRSVLGELLQRVRYTLNFYRLIWRERKEYDTVFVHMNQEYVLLGGPFWKLLGKKVTMWRNHPTGNMLTRMAMVFSDAMFCTSEHSFIATSKKTTIMPAGIDTSMFKRDSAVQKIKNSVVYVGRIAPIKNIDVLIDAVAELDKMGHEFTLHLIGDVLPLDASYLNLLKEKAASLIANNKVAFLGSIPNRNLSVAYDRYEIVVNMTDSGSFDKTILEGMACEGLTVVSNRSFVGVLPEDTLFEERNSHDLARVLVHVLDISGDERVRRGKELREVVEQHHSLALLAQELISSFTQSKR